MKRDGILEAFRGASSGISVNEILSRLRIDPFSAEGCAVEALLFFLPEIRYVDGRWRIVEPARADRILTAIESYASTTGRKVFRAAAALESLPLKDQPTIEELAGLLQSAGGAYSLLPNAMIKRNQ